MQTLKEVQSSLNNNARKIADIDREIKYLQSKIASLECDKTRILIEYEHLLEDEDILKESENEQLEQMQKGAENETW